LGAGIRVKYGMLKCEGRWAAKIEDLLAASDERLGIKPKEPIMGTCKVCAGEFVSTPNRRYCGDACRAVTIKGYDDARRAKKKQARQLHRTPTF